jgi:ABC-type transport system involved in multi-copper enzyme maturation permease subunit
VHRFGARRFIRVLLVLAAVAYLGVVTLMALSVFDTSTPEELAVAREQQAQAIAEQNRSRDACLRQPPPPGEELPADQRCGPEANTDNVPLDSFTDGTPFVLTDYLPAGAVAIGGLTAALTFLIGATAIGAEWSTRSIVALLFWEPRRLKVIGVKLLVTAAAAAVIGVVAQMAWVATAGVLAHTRGSAGDLPAGFWSDVFQQQARCVLLAALMAMLGFSIANLIRNTGAALGIAFVYFVMLEPVVRAVRPVWQQWLLVPNIGALLGEDGNTIIVGPGPGQRAFEPYEVVLSNVHGGLVIAGLTAVIVATGVVLFKRRDLH